MPYSDNLYSMTDGDSDGEYAQMNDGRPRPSQQDGQGRRDSLSSVDDADVLSPSDGYFRASDAASESTWQAPSGNAAPPQSSNVPDVPNILVADPTIERESAAAGKAREAAQERVAAQSTTASSSVGRRTPPPSTPRSGTQSGHGLASPSVITASPTTSRPYTSYGSRRGVFEQQQNPIPNEAPPAYTPSEPRSHTSPTSPTSASSERTNLSPTHSRHYNTFSDPEMRRDESQGLLAREPQSMNDRHRDESSDEVIVPAWQRPVRRAAIGWPRNCSMFIVGFFLLLTTAGLLASMIRAISKGTGSDDSSQWEPHLDYPEADSDLEWIPHLSCRNAQFKWPTHNESLQFNDRRSVHFVQKVHHTDHYHRSLRVAGHVYVRRSGTGTPEPSIVVEAITNDERIKLEYSYDKSSQGVILSVPDSVQGWDGHNGDSPCVAIKTTIWVPSDAVLGEFSVETVQLGVHLLDNLALRVSSGTEVSTTSGDITGGTPLNGERFDIRGSPPSSFVFDSRTIEVSSTSGDIHGFWPLLDVLSLSSTSGTIVAGITPKPAAKQSTAAPVLKVKTTSGDIDLWEPIDRIHDDDQEYTDEKEAIFPPRDYQVLVDTTSGTVNAGVAFSSNMHVKSTSGDIKLDLLPVLDSTYEQSDVDSSRRSTRLETTSTSGTTDVKLYEPLWTSHKKQSGNGAWPRLPDVPDQPEIPGIPETPSLPAHPKLPTLPDDSKDENSPRDPSPYPTLPVGDKDPYDILPPLAARAAADKPKTYPFRALAASHRTTSANIKLRYPASWEGDLEIQTTSGSVRTGGDDLDVVDPGPTWPPVGKHVLLRKGEEGADKVTVNALSGNVDFFVGE